MLDLLRNQKKDIRIAIVGIGSMGKGLFYQSRRTPGIEAVAVADVRIKRAVSCAEWLGRDYSLVRTPGQMSDAIRQGKVAVCEDGALAAECEDVDVFVEASNSIIPALAFSVTALKSRKHLVLMNAEIDLHFGPYLLRLARENGVIYTSCDGDQHGAIKHLIDDLRLWGFDLVMAGNIKGYLDRYSNPTAIVPEADLRNLDYKMAVSYTDGSKLSFEMALVANGLGLSTLVPGMHGPRAGRVNEVLRLFDFDALWKDRRPFVDYILGAEPGGGVFAVGHCDNEYQKSMLQYYKMGCGPYYLFYRPYHLCHVEAMACIADAALNHRPLLQPDHGFRTNVYAYAKRDLRRGEILDGIGGYLTYGLIENCAGNESNPGLPLGLAEGVPLGRDIRRDGKIHLSDVHYDPARPDFAAHFKAVDISREGGR
jgi:predicted homoserine dehydrogenase-like protein